MELVNALAVGLGGAAGALARYAVGLAVGRRAVDTLAVNVLGSFLLGFVLGIGVDGVLRLGAGVGFCGAFTTFSSHAVEAVRLAEDGDTVAAIGYVATTFGLASLAVVVGVTVGGLSG